MFALNISINLMSTWLVHKLSFAQKAMITMLAVTTFSIGLWLGTLVGYYVN
jgi:hypothetical protein